MLAPRKDGLDQSVWIARTALALLATLATLVGLLPVSCFLGHPTWLLGFALSYLRSSCGEFRYPKSSEVKPLTSQ